LHSPNELFVYFFMDTIEGSQDVLTCTLLSQRWEKLLTMVPFNELCRGMGNGLCLPFALCRGCGGLRLCSLEAVV
jgi:hypothetical protein